MKTWKWIALGTATVGGYYAYTKRKEIVKYAVKKLGDWQEDWEEAKKEFNEERTKKLCKSN